MLLHFRETAIFLSCCGTQVVESFLLVLSVCTVVLVNPQISIFAVKASASQVVDDSPAVDVSALLFHKQVHQEQKFSEQFVESVKEVPQVGWS